MSILDGAPDTSPSTGRRPGRRRGRGLVAALVVLLILVAAAVVVDRVVVDRVEAEVVDTVEGSFAADGVTTSVGGFPFLTQVAAGRLSQVDLTAGSAVYEGTTITDIDASVSGLAFDLGTRSLGLAERLTASGTLPTASLQSLVAAQLTDLPDLTISTVDGQLVGSIPIIGGLAAEVGLVPRAADGQIAVDIAGVTVAGFEVTVAELPAGIADRLTDLRIDVPGLPDGLALTDLTVVDDGVRVTVAGTDVDLSQG